MLTTRSRRKASDHYCLLLIVTVALALWGCQRESETPLAKQTPADPPSVVTQTSEDKKSTQIDKADPPIPEEVSNTAVTEDSEESASFADNPAGQPAARPEEQTIEIPASWNRLGKHEIWIDFQEKQVIVAGTICLNIGPLEMFACPANTKEHESIISANALSSEVHAALIALGAEPGSPCQWDPEYKPANGPVIDIQVTWFDEEQEKPVKVSAPSMIRNSRTRKPMTHQWVFGGSQIWEDPDNGDKIYYGDAGEMVCLSNFSTATMDLTVESSQSNDGLLFEALTENIPPIGTKVYMHLKPGKRIEAAPAPETKNQNPSGESAEETDDDR